MATAEAVSQLQSIPLEKIQPSPFQTRKQFDEQKLKELAQTLKDHGLLNAIVVRQVKDKFELVSGERRLRAAKLLGWRTIEAKVEQVDDREAAEQAVVENLQRQDLNPIEQAEGYKKLEDMGLTQETIARRVGINDRTVVTRTLALLDLEPETQEIVARATISVGHCRCIGAITDPKLQVQIARLAASGGWSVKETERRVEELVGKKPKKKAPAQPPVDPLAKGWEKLGVNLEIPQGTWAVHYKGAGQWAITLHTPGITPVADMTRWLKAALEAMRAVGPDKSANPAIQIKPTADPAGYEITIKPEYAPRNEAELLKAEAESKNERLPRNAKEEAELYALAAQGPAAVSRWVYGPNSFYARQSEGKTWKDYGYDDPEKAVREMIDGLKKLAGDLNG